MWVEGSAPHVGGLLASGLRITAGPGLEETRESGCSLRVEAFKA